MAFPRRFLIVLFVMGSGEAKIALNSIISFLWKKNKMLGIHFSFRINPLKKLKRDIFERLVMISNTERDKSLKN